VLREDLRDGRAGVVGDERSPEYVNPSVFDTRFIDVVAAAVREAAIEEDIARRTSLVQEDDSTLAAVK